jgi:hypothetical protein
MFGVKGGGPVCNSKKHFCAIVKIFLFLSENYFAIS